MSEERKINLDIQLIRRIFYAFCLIIFCIFYYNNLMLHQLQGPVLIFPHANNTYWLLHYLGIPQFLVSSFAVSLVFDLVLLVSAALSMVYWKNKAFPWIFFICYFLYFITFNSYMTHHSHGFVGMLFMAAVMCVRSTEGFASAFALLRYYTLFIIISAGLWKLGRGSVFNPEQMLEILKSQHLYQLIHYPESFYTSFIYWLIDLGVWTQPVFALTVLLQLSFTVGFFTRKYDKILFVMFFVFFIGDKLFMDLSFYKIYILSITLLTWQGLEETSKQEPGELTPSG